MAWEAYACGAALQPKIRTVHGPRRARGLYRIDLWVVTLFEGRTALTFGPMGMAAHTGDREACVELADTIVAAGFGNVENVSSPELADVVRAWRDRQQPTG